MMMMNNMTFNAPFLYDLDTFVGTVGTEVASHAMNVGRGWTNVSVSFGAGLGDAQLTGSGAASITINNSTTYTTYITDTGFANGNASIVVTPGANAAGIGGLVFRYSASNNFWVALVANANNSNHVFLQKNVNGSITTVSQPVRSGVSPFTITVKYNGNNITVLQGSNTITTTDSFNSTATKCGIIGTTQGFLFNKFQVQRI